MLDYFLLKGYVSLNEDGCVKRTEKCPRDIIFLENADGIIKFFFDYKTQLVPIREPDDFELTKTITLTPTSGITTINTI